LCFLEDYMVQTLFKRVIGDTSRIRILEFLIEGRELDYSLSDIAEGAGIGRTTLFRIFNNFLKSGIVVPTRVIGNAKLFKLDMESVFVQKLIQVFDEVIMPKKKVLA